MTAATTELFKALSHVSKVSENQYRANCPACGDKKQHLYINFAPDGKILLDCKKGCTFSKITTAMGIPAKDFFPEQPQHAPWELIREHVYTDINGGILGKKQIYRKPDGNKSAVWYRLENGHYIKGLGGVKFPPYHLHKFTKTTGTLVIVEGEKDVETVERLEYAATTSPNGAGSKWRKEYNKYLKGRNVVIITDNDEAGETYGKDIAEKIQGDAADVKLIRSADIYPDVKHKGDISDIAAAVGDAETKQLLIDAIKRTANYKPDAAPNEGAAPEPVNAAELSEPLEAVEIIEPTDDAKTEPDAAPARELPFYFYENSRGKICVDPALLLIHIQKQEHYFWVASDAMDGVRRYFYNEQRGVYEWLSDERIKGRIKNYITKELSTAIKVKDINETFNLLVLDECRYSDSAIDSGEQLVNFENGFYNIETGQILPHSSGVLSTIQLSLRFDPTRNYTLDDAPNFKQYITTITNGDPEKQTLMLEYMGAALSNVPGYKFKSALFLVGAGNTGKSKYIELIYSLLGEGNFASISFADLEERFQSGAIYGKRLVCDADMKVQRAKGNSLFMKITGGDPVQIEYKGMNLFTTKHRGFLLFASNAMPRWSGNTTDAAYNRMMIIECNNVIPPERQDPDLLNKLLSERGVIVSLALDALRGAVQRGYKFTRPAAMTASINKLRRDNCPSIDFFEACCMEYDDANSNYEHCMKRSVMHRVFVNWCRINAPSAYIPSARDFYHDILQYKQLPDGSLIKIWHGHRYYTFTLTLDAKEQFYVFDNVN